MEKHFLFLFCIFTFAFGKITFQRNAALGDFLKNFEENSEQFLKEYPRAPQLESIIKAAKGTCLIQSNNGTGTGFLVTPKYVVTNAHVIGSTQPSNIRLKFGYYTNNTNNRYYVEKTIKSVELNPAVKNLLQNGSDLKNLNPAFDWAVLELNQPFTAAEAKERVLDIAPGTYSEMPLVLNRPFILHHGEGEPMKISYVEYGSDVTQQNQIKINSFCYLFPNCLITIDSGSSGSAFCDDGGIVRGVVVGGYNSKCSVVGETGSPLMWLIPFDVLLDYVNGSSFLKKEFFTKGTGLSIINQNMPLILADYYQRNSSDGTKSPFIAEIQFRTGGSIVMSIGAKNTVTKNGSIDDLLTVQEQDEFGVDIGSYNYKILGKQAICFADLFPNNGQGRYRFTLNIGGHISVTGHPDISQYRPNNIPIYVWIADKNLSRIRDLTTISVGGTQYSRSYEYDIILSEQEPALETYIVFELTNNSYTDQIRFNNELINVNVRQEVGFNISNVGWEPTNGWLKVQSIQYTGGKYNVVLSKAVNNPNFSYYIMKSIKLCRDENGINYSTDNLGSDHKHCDGYSKHNMGYSFEEDHFYGSASDVIDEVYNHGQHHTCCHHSLFFCDCWEPAHYPCRQYLIKSVVYTYEVYNSNGTRIGDRSYDLIINLPYEKPSIITFNSGQQFFYANAGQKYVLSISNTGNFVTYDWFENSQVLKSGSENFLTLPSISINDNGKQYWCRLSNPRGEVSSSIITFKISDYPYPKNEQIYSNKVTISTGIDAYFPVLNKPASNSFRIDWGDGTPATTGTHDFTKQCRNNNSCYWTLYSHWYKTPGLHTISVYVDGYSDPVSKNIVITKPDITPVINSLLFD